jgi:hypothetical protein
MLKSEPIPNNLCASPLNAQLRISKLLKFTSAVTKFVKLFPTKKQRNYRRHQILIIIQVIGGHRRPWKAVGRPLDSSAKT